MLCHLPQCSTSALLSGSGCDKMHPPHARNQQASDTPAHTDIHRHQRSQAEDCSGVSEAACPAGHCQLLAAAGAQERQDHTQSAAQRARPAAGSGCGRPGKEQSPGTACGAGLFKETPLTSPACCRAGVGGGGGESGGLRSISSRRLGCWPGLCLAGDWTRW